MYVFTKERQMYSVFHFAFVMLITPIVLDPLLSIRNHLFQNYLQIWILMMTLMKSILQVMTFNSALRNPLKQARLYSIRKGSIPTNCPQPISSWQSFCCETHSSSIKSLLPPTAHVCFFWYEV